MGLYILLLDRFRLNRLGIGGQPVENIVEHLAGVVALCSSIVDNPCELIACNTTKEEIHRCQKIVSGSDGEASPSRPDGTGGEKCQLLCSRQLLDGSLNVIETGNN